VPGGREPAHVQADLGDDDRGGEPGDARDRGQELDGGLKRSQAGIDLPVDPGDGRLQGVDLVQVQAEQEPVIWRHPPAKRLLELLRRRREPRMGERRQRGRTLSPSASASSIARPLAPRRFASTASSLMLASSSVFCRRWV
jgi:hypothetical protein